MYKIARIKIMISQIEKNSIDKITEKIIANCFKIHSSLGPGFKEKIYHNALKMALGKDNIKYETEKEYSVFYEDKKVGKLKVDLIIESKVILEIKAVTGNIPVVFRDQLLSYLKVSGLSVGLLINFGNNSCQVNRLAN